MDKIKLVIIDDHQVVRDGLKGYFELLDDFEIIGEGSSGEDAVRLAEEQNPHIILLDLQMPGMDGVTATRKILQNNPEIKIVILTSFSGEDDILPAIKAGAVGYLLKDISPDDLAEALREASMGNTRIHPNVAKKLMQTIRTPAKDTLLGSVTPRELDVLKEIGKGKSNKEIAFDLSISTTTVKTHVSNLLGKLNAADRTQLALFAVNNRLVE